MEKLTLDDRLEIARYEAFRIVRFTRSTVRNRTSKKLLTRIMRRLKTSIPLTSEQAGVGQHKTRKNKKTVKLVAAS